MSTLKKKAITHYCAKCKRDDGTWRDPAEASGMFVGTFYSESAQKVLPYRGYLCDMHADQAESGQFVSISYRGIGGE